ncbi:alanyl-tRNA editing protein [Anaerosalibacter bizertensis]|uniref:alanyl-tRNA editing protein n=1 Tax=Anaerosalibacter bizertensis TaxID=932217 RepID=UPI001C0F00CF|nr:alanyl-tRNA editing protein [Anaerosalibacter bizertensis]MBU5294031.1 alanyl-tRNA editing protein [Anaerosalibacter bizertensis]
MTEHIYLENPYLREISARIVDKKYMNNKFYLKLNRTIFYPNLKGGQPRDKGTINGLEVIDIYEEGNDIIHVIKENILSDKVQLSIDWNTRLDYMQQHSGQHLLSSIFYKLYGAETIGFYIGKTCVYIDIDIPKLKKEDIVKVEDFANKVIYSNFDIKTYIIGKKDIDKVPIRKYPNVRSDIRIVEIDGMDYSPCCGTHHRSTGEIGMIKIRNWEKYKGNVRVEFVCGNRALKDYAWKNDCINSISTLLSSKDTDIYEKIEKLYLEKEKLEKENRDLKEELLKYKAKDLPEEKSHS